MDDASLLRELEPVAARLLDRHLGTTKEWFPHELATWGRGRDCAPGEAWEARPLHEGVTSALYVTLLPEDNPPNSFQTIGAVFAGDAAWPPWTRRWTAEEGRHAIV